MGCQQSIPLDDASSHITPVKAATVGGFIAQESAAKALVGIKQQQQRKSTPNMSPSASTESVKTARTAFSSSTVSLAVDEDVSYLLPKVDYNGHLLKEEIVKRTSSSIQSSALSIGKGTNKFELQYAYRSQRGYDPREPLKPNQEKHGITLNFASEGGDAMIGVYSGHGEKGKQCAHLCETTLPKQLAKFIRQKRVQRYTAQLKAEGKLNQGAWNPNMWPILSKSEYEQCCKRAFQETKALLQQQEDMKNKQSGASALAVSFHGGRMYVCNVGGCGAILGRRGGSTDFNGEEEKCEIDDPVAGQGRRIAIQLVDDHTPCCQEELARIKSAGADVHNCVDDECTSVLFDSDAQPTNDGNERSLRAFVPGKEGPGTKLTRSICDKSLEDIGIISDPSIISCDLTSDDEVLIIASSAVFTYLTNQKIMDICSTCHDPLEASEAITKAAYEKWIERTNRCDDITVIVCYLSNFSKPVQRIKMPSDLLGMMIDHDDE